MVALDDHTLLGTDETKLDSLRFPNSSTLLSFKSPSLKPPSGSPLWTLFLIQLSLPPFLSVSPSGSPPGPLSLPPPPSASSSNAVNGGRPDTMCHRPGGDDHIRGIMMIMMPVGPTR